MATLVQLRYVLAVAETQSFSAAAKSCHVTQPTLSMQLHKLEEELEITLFDRMKKPIVPTEAGREVIAQARRVMSEFERIEQIAHTRRGVVAGRYTLGVIPTLAPSLVPLFLRPFTEAYPEVHLSIREMTTAEIVRALTEGAIDGGLLATPLEDSRIQETPIFDEPFCLYHSPKLSLGHTARLAVKDLPLERILLMAEGHCLRTQVVDFCALSDGVGSGSGFVLESGSLETLMRVVDQSEAFTVLPKLALQELSEKRRAGQVKEFAGIVPYREISLVTYRSQVKAAINEALIETVEASLPKDLLMMGRRKAERMRPV